MCYVILVQEGTSKTQVWLNIGTLVAVWGVMGTFHEHYSNTFNIYNAR